MEECDTDEEVSMHIRVVNEEDKLSESSGEECDGMMKAEHEEESSNKGRQRCKKHKGLVERGDGLSSTPRRRASHDCPHRHHEKDAGRLNVSPGNTSIDSMKHLTSGVSCRCIVWVGGGGGG